MQQQLKIYVLHNSTEKCTSIVQALISLIFNKWCLINWQTSLWGLQLSHMGH